MMHGHSEKVRIIVAFGDLSGFTAFWDSVTNDEKELDPFLDKFDDLVEEIEKETGYDFTDTGDGFMVTVDLQPGHNCVRALRLLISLLKFLKKIRKLIEEARMHGVAPDDFRIVVACGYVKRKVKRNGRIAIRGKHINLAHNLLDLARGHGIMCLDGFKQLISEKQAKNHNFRFTKFKSPKTLPHGVSPYEANRLWIVEEVHRRST